MYKHTQYKYNFFNYLGTEDNRQSSGLILSGLVVTPEINFFHDSNSYGHSLANT